MTISDTPLVPTATDEGQHSPQDVPHWSESWYFDAVSDDRTIGVYTRLGRVPARGTALYSAAIVMPGGSTFMLVDPAADLPDDPGQTVTTDRFHADQLCVEPLQSFRVRLRGTAAAHADHAAPLRAEDGTDVDVELDLVWETDGTPYRWQLTDRYEIPCRVTGTVRIGDTVHEFAGPGQRDHSWGPRDWWGHEWMWSAFHLEDGTRTHAVVIDDLPGLMIGYAQQAGELTELTSGSYAAEPDADGLVRSDELVLADAGLTLSVRPTGFGPLRLVSDEGRVAFFTRAMAEVTTDDGRRGVGWIEWNRVQPD